MLIDYNCHGKRRFMFWGLLLITVVCTHPQIAVASGQPPEVRFSRSGTALLSIPSLNGNQIAVRIQKPSGDGPFPTLIGVAGGDGQYAFRSGLSTDLLNMDTILVDFAPQGRGESEGEDNYHGYVHQDDLKTLVDFVQTLPMVQRKNIGLLSYSYGVVLATGALARYPDMPVAFLIDWEGPSCPGKDMQRGLERDELWVHEVITFLNNGRALSQEELLGFRLHGGLIFDDVYWAERDASRFAADLPCPYLRVQFDTDHVQGTFKNHMINIINAATAHSGQWTRCNDNPPNIMYAEDDLVDKHFHTYLEGEMAGFTSDSKSINTVLRTYVEEMIFSRPYESSSQP